MPNVSTSFSIRRDERVADFRYRPLDAGPHTFSAADALVLKIRPDAFPQRGWAYPTRSGPATKL